MKALVTDGKGNLSFEDVRMPEYSEYQALVKVLSGGICGGTDIKIIHGMQKDFHSYPAILGHEGVGEVVEIGSKVTKFKKGDIVLLPFLETEIDGYHSRHGAFAEYAVVGDFGAAALSGKGKDTPYYGEHYYAQQIVPPSIDPIDASMIVTFREVYSAMKKFGFMENMKTVIFGIGPVGMSFIRFAKLFGLSTIVALGNKDDQLIEGRKLGATHVFNSNDPNTMEDIIGICPGGYDLIVDAVGDNKIISSATELVKYGGKVCSYGSFSDQPLDLDLKRLPYNWTLQFENWPSKYEEALSYQSILNFIELGVLDPSDFISHVFDFENAKDAFKIIEEHGLRKKIVLKF